MNALLTTALLALIAADDNAVKKDLKLLEGDWVVTKLEYSGNDITERYPLRFVIKGSEIAIEGDAGVKKEYGRFAIKIDPSTSPRCIDIKVTLGVQKDVTMEGIYDVKKDELRLCVKVLGNDRPTEFKNGDEIALVTLKRKDK
ncbi:MAG: TIGR03067 domain-containing protein [Gemmataceae bacterium]